MSSKISDDETRFLYILEMFPNVDLVYLNELVQNSSSMSFDSAVEYMVKQCLQNQSEHVDVTSSYGENNSGTNRTSDDNDVIVLSTVSLVPPQLSSRNDGVSERDTIETIVEQIGRASNSMQSLRVLKRVLLNVIEEPRKEAYRRLSLTNQKLKAKLHPFEERVIRVLTMCGFVRVDTLLMLTDDGFESHRLNSALQTVTKVINDKKARESVDNDILYQKNWKKRHHKEVASSHTRPHSSATKRPVVRLTREQLAERTMQRLRSEATDEIDAPGAGTVIAGRIGNFQNNLRLQKQIADIRAQKHGKWRNTKYGRQRVFTMDDIHRMRSEDMDIRSRKKTDFSSTRKEWDAIGQDELKYTNEFRTKHGKPPLKWHQALCDIAYEHSKNMGEGKAEFSHDGFDERVQRYPFAHTGAAENLHWADISVSSAARVAVDGWISSPGHRKNLLSNQTWCGIGVYVTGDGKVYSTQLFART